MFHVSAHNTSWENIMGVHVDSINTICRLNVGVANPSTSAVYLNGLTLNQNERTELLSANISENVSLKAL